MRRYRLASVVRDLLLVFAPVIAAIVLSYQLSVRDQESRAQIVADVVLVRSDLTATQLTSAFERLEDLRSASACSVDAVDLMRQVDLASSMLQGVGFVEGDQLKCSSLANTTVVDVRAPDYVSATGTIIRRQRELPISPGTPLLLVTGRAGFTGLVHPALIFSLSDDRVLPAGLATYSTRDTLIHSSTAAFDWARADMPTNRLSGTLVVGDQLIAWKRSAKWDQFSYAAVPLAAVSDEFQGSIGFYLGGGLAVGTALLLLVRWFSASRTSLQALLKAGISNGEVSTVYQPIVDMRTERWVGAEVLARWRRPTGEVISPEVFVAIAEKHGLIRQLTRRVVEGVADDLKKLVQLDPEFFVSVNITSIDLEDPDFPKQLVAECDARGISHNRVHLEITERTQVDPTQEAKSILTLQGHGFEIGIDDFGIGYSNLAYLHTLHINYLKIDKAFVAAISNGAIGTDVIDHIIQLGNERGLTLIAEGVEQEEQRAALVSRGVWFGQGWLFGAPLPALDLLVAYDRGHSSVITGPSLGRVA